MRVSRLIALLVFFAAVVAGQQVPFVPITGPNAPKGAAYLYEDSRGGLWMGAIGGVGAEGLAYFDGSRFVSPMKGAFPKVGINGLAEDSDGGIWAASTGGLFRLFNGQLEKIVDGANFSGIAKLAPDVFLMAIAKSGSDISADASLVRVTRTPGGWTAETIMKPVRHLRLQLDHSGNVLYPCQGGFCEFRAADVLRWHSGSVLKIVRHAILRSSDDDWSLGTVLRDRFGCVWVRDTLGSLSYQCPGESRSTVLPVNIAGRGGRLIYELDDGSVVIPGLEALAIGRPGRFRVISALNGYQGGPYSLATKDGSIWSSTANGLSVFPAHSKIEFWSERDGLGGNTWSVLPLGKKVFAIAGEEIRVLNADRSRWLVVAELGGATHLLAGPGNTILASSQSNGVIQMSLQGKILRMSNSTDAMMLAQTPDAQAWMSGSEISRIKLTGKHLILQPQKVPDPQGGGMDMKVDRNGGLWTCYSGGLIHKDDAGWHEISTRDGLLQNWCGSFAIDRKKDVWYGYASQPSFSLIEDPTGHPRIEHFSSGAELGNTTARFFASDSRGWLWRGSPIGIYVADLAQARQGQWLFLNRTDGLPGTDANQRSFVEDSDGSVWFGMDNSVIHMFPPVDLVHPTYAPNVFVSGFSWNNGPFQMADMMDNIQHGANIVAHIGSLQFDRRNALRLRYRLLPEQSDWKPERDLDISLGKLSWGKHTLEVQARLYTGPWSSTVCKSFTVLKPIWLSWPALLGFAAAGSVAAAGGQRWRKKQRERAETTLPALAEWRLAVLSPDQASLEGALLDGRFEVRRVLARGGFATVFQGYDAEQGQACAVKIFRHELLEKSWMGRRFQQEVSALQQIRHANVVRIFGHGTTPTGAPYLAMELIDGKTLRDLLKETKVDRQQAASYLRQTGSALAEIHAHGICHRDLKPENLMIRNVSTARQDLVLIDFSIAIVQDPDETMHGLSRAAGTLHYMAPEQGVGYADASSDIYSLAKILLEMLTGQRLSSLLPDASLDLPVRIREFLNATPFGLSPASIDLIAGALEFDPARRLKDARQFAGLIAQDLERRI